MMKRASFRWWNSGLCRAFKITPPPGPREEFAVVTNDQKRDQAEARFARTQKKIERAEEGKKALADHEIEAARVNDNTMRLRVLRLAKEVADRKIAQLGPTPNARIKTRSA